LFAATIFPVILVVGLLVLKYKTGKVASRKA